MATTLENRIVRLETIIEQMATKEDIAKLENAMLKWGIGLVLSNIGIAIAISFAAHKFIG